MWDGAPSHADATVRAVGLSLVALPPSSPELNPAERLFKEVHRRVEGTVYPTLDAKVAAVQTFLEELAAAPARVRRLCGWDWLLEAHHALLAPSEEAA
ncbi:MAG: hypothetical protein M3N68_02105 [Actinomycetota bacterium]|nr:hypothetical protein [Actinomycetota bacterium]